MDQIKVANFINVQSSHPVTFFHGQMQVDKTHRMADLEPVVHQHLEAIFRINLVTAEIMRVIQAKVGCFTFEYISILVSMDSVIKYIIF